MLLLLCMLAGVSTARADTQSREDLWNVADQKLRGALTHKYAHVAQWTLERQLGNARRREFPEGLPTDVEVVSTGVRSSVRLTWRAAGSVQQMRTLWFNVIGEAPAAIAQRRFVPGDALSRADAAVDVRNILVSGCAPLADPKMLDGMRARRILSEGAIVCTDAIEKRPPVGRGDVVSVHYVSERVQVAAKGIAQQDGQLGQRLRVVNPASKEVFSAVVSGASEVTIHE